ncbi:MAG: hypothetical protein GX790_01045 [Syntrophomonadaceae bacterium]|nr:hypothetical protein [Syntrophomonadaceae bacterium]
MQLKPGERALLAYFTDTIQAQQALAELKKAGFTDIRIDQLRSSSNRIAISNNLSSMIYGNSGFDGSYGPLLAANPIVSGMSSQNEANPIYSLMITMVVDNDNYEKAANIIRQNGGSI